MSESYEQMQMRNEGASNYFDMLVRRSLRKVREREEKEALENEPMMLAASQADLRQRQAEDEAEGLLGREAEDAEQE